MEVLEVLFIVWVLLGVVDVVLAVLEDLVQVPAPLALKFIENLIKSI